VPAASPWEIRAARTNNDRVVHRFAPSFRRVARRLAEGPLAPRNIHCLAEAKQAGYLAMQFNFVVSTNTAAVALWRKLEFEIVGTLPKAFRHREHGLVDACVMHRFL
jgi:hypothetical protein